MALAHYDALTARAFDRVELTSDAEPALEADTITSHHERMDRASRIAAAIGGTLLHLGVPCLATLAWWLNT
ncbi:MAG TPA: hypothetical protein VFX59_01605 [Polyangiales bacterium]|nr:hypothetical protein [Polyangiales bacterium]